jgi:hypothetical protein
MGRVAQASLAAVGLLTPAAAPTTTTPPTTARPATTRPPTTARVVATTHRPTTSVRPPRTTAAPSLCGAPDNPYGYNFCGRGGLITSPPADICLYFECIPNFDNGSGYMVECHDTMYSMSGGRQGACSYHDGVWRPVTAEPPPAQMAARHWSRRGPGGTPWIVRVIGRLLLTAFPYQ